MTETVENLDSEQETIKQRLERLHKQRNEIDEQIVQCYRESFNAPAANKACPDWMAQTLSEPIPSLHYPVELLGVNHEQFPCSFVSNRDGLMLSLVAIRPCVPVSAPTKCAPVDPGNTTDLVPRVPKERTYLGVYIGEIAASVQAIYDKSSGVLTVGPGGHNPAIWVPELKRIVWGCESWWNKITKASEIPEITDEQIANTWYVKALRERLEQSNA